RPPDHWSRPQATVRLPGHPRPVECRVRCVLRRTARTELCTRRTRGEVDRRRDGGWAAAAVAGQVRRDLPADVAVAAAPRRGEAEEEDEAAAADESVLARGVVREHLAARVELPAVDLDHEVAAVGQHPAEVDPSEEPA